MTNVIRIRMMPVIGQKAISSLTSQEDTEPRKLIAIDRKVDPRVGTGVSRQLVFLNVGNGGIPG